MKYVRTCRGIYIIESHIASVHDCDLNMRIKTLHLTQKKNIIFILRLNWVNIGYHRESDDDASLSPQLICARDVLFFLIACYFIASIVTPVTKWRETIDDHTSDTLNLFWEVFRLSLTQNITIYKLQVVSS